jgi:hypothetical protein
MKNQARKDGGARKRTEQEMIDRAKDPDWYGISDEVLKKMIAQGLIKDKMPPDMEKNLKG